MPGNNAISGVTCGKKRIKGDLKTCAAAPPKTHKNRQKTVKNAPLSIPPEKNGLVLFLF